MMTITPFVHTVIKNDLIFFTHAINLVNKIRILHFFSNTFNPIFRPARVQRLSVTCIDYLHLNPLTIIAVFSRHSLVLVGITSPAIFLSESEPGPSFT